nr:PASTA domain-containing protein [Streptomyces sp. SBE_14.2]
MTRGMYVRILLVCVLALSACDVGRASATVRAVAVGVPSLAPFFDESKGLGRDARVPSRSVGGGLQRGDTPGLYGGSRKPRICDVDKLERFLTDPANERKADAWARVLGIGRDGIPDYLDRLTPVLLRHDTLVKNHDYKKEKAVPFDSLLQAGIAILVDAQGQPAVKCSCGNPLRAFEGDKSGISVKFENGNEKWKGYDAASAVVVRPAPRELERLALVDVEEPERGIERPVGTTGGDDKGFDASERREVPDVVGATVGEAVARLTEQGLAVRYGGAGQPPDGAVVTGSDPAAGSRLAFGEYVTLAAEEDAEVAPETSRTSGPPDPPTPSESEAETEPVPTQSSGGSGPTSSGTTSSPPPTSEQPPASTPPPTSTSAPPPTVSSLPPPPSSTPPTTISTPPTTATTTTTAPASESPPPPPPSETPSTSAST